MDPRNPQGQQRSGQQQNRPAQVATSVVQPAVAPIVAQPPPVLDPLKEDDTLTIDATDINFETDTDLETVISNAVEGVLQETMTAADVQKSIQDWVDIHEAPSREEVDAIIQVLNGTVATIQQKLQWLMQR